MSRVGKGTVRTLRCQLCADVYVETWHGDGSSDYTVAGTAADGTALGETLRGCPQHPTHPWPTHGDRGPHALAVQS